MTLGIFDYPRLIKTPMDLGLVKKRIDKGSYNSVFDAAEDVRLVWKNCMAYNPVGTEYHTLAEKLSTQFEKKYSQLCAKNGGGSPALSKIRTKKSSGESPNLDACDSEKKPAAQLVSWAESRVMSLTESPALTTDNIGEKTEARTREHDRKQKLVARSKVKLSSTELTESQALTADDIEEKLAVRSKEHDRKQKPAAQSTVKLSSTGSSTRVVSARNAKRNRSVYTEELDEGTDSDDLLSSEDEARLENRRTKDLARKRKKNAEATGIEHDTDADVVNKEENHGDTLHPVIIHEIESPPTGHLHCLWYSREPFLHVFVLDKILGYKTRPVMTLETCVTNETNGDNLMEPISLTGGRFHLDFNDALKLKEKAIVETGNDFRRRREISRINPGHCPYIKQFAANMELARSVSAGSDPKFKAIKSAEREEVFLVKWRGRSYVHCSWERQCDLEKYDQSAQQGAVRGKLTKFVQSQVMALGHNWKKVLEDSMRAQSSPVTHTHHSQNPIDNGNKPAKSNIIDEDVDDEDYFPPVFLEVDRIIGCDENELDMNVLARQRALNIRAEREALKKREQEDDEEEKWLTGSHAKDKGDSSSDMRQEILLDRDLSENGEEWDPEDNVRYIVRWKGLQLIDATWEYWIDIKRDFVDEVEDFWLRQEAPSLEDAEEMAIERHPHPRSFKKLNESPIFGVSKVKRQIAKLEDDVVVDVPIDSVEGSVLKLRAYQLEGVNWLLWNWYNQRSCILADEMGLGKTIQSIGFLHGLQNLPKGHVRGPFLIVAPLSLVSQWEAETKEWAPDMNAVVYHGSADARDFLVKNEFYYTEQYHSKVTAQTLKRKHFTKFQLLITTYEVVLKDVNILTKIHWKALIVDEAHRLKNIKSKLFEDLASVPRDWCLLLTGTPLQNSTEELWALLHFCDPAGFGSKDDFTNKFGQLQDADQVANLHTVLRPYLLRRVKEDVEKALPPKEETILEVSLTPIQKQFYKAIYEKNTGFLFKGTKPSNAPSLMNVMMELRKCCNHPFLIRGAEDRIIDDAAENARRSLTPNEQIYRDIDYAKLTGEQLVKSSGKFVLLSKLLPKLQSGGHKVLIFSQMVRVLDLLQELLQLNHYSYERLDGSTSASARNAAVDRFKRESLKRFVMLLSTRAGGLGLNLTAADTVVIFDSDWNPQNDLQAMARAHRIGQTRSVRVYRLLTAKTYEMHMFHSASLKLGLDRAVLAHQRQNTNPDESSSKRKSKAEREEQAKEIDQLLKKGAYDVFNDDDDKEAQKFMDTDIDQLLEQSSRKVTYGDTATSSLSSGLGSFSKASFVAGEGDGKDVDLDDPDFWSKAIGFEAPPEDLDPNMALIIDGGSKRSRKQVQAFDPLKDEADAEQRRLEMIALQKQEEKEEKERKKLEKILMKEAERDAKEKKRKEAVELKEKLKEKKLLQVIKGQKDHKSKEVKRRVKEVKVVYNDRKTDRKRALKRAEHEDPVFERVKQAWDTSQRSRIVNAILRFGFGRFCKVRNESNFTSLPIQDVEVFARSYIYQLGLQAAYTLLSTIDCGEALVPDIDHIVRESLHKVLSPLVGEGKDFDWICNAILTSLCMHMRMKSHDAFVRMPLTLAEPSFMFDLRQGAAIRSLHRISFLSRLNNIIEEALDRAISEIGCEAMGKRGCLTNNFSTLDMDLKARYITTEELMYALSINMNVALESYKLSCPPWWDRSCDLGLLIGTFFHGLGSYEAMRIDEDLPFSTKIKSYVMCNTAEAESYHHFEMAADAAKSVFDTALVTMKRKFQEQTHAAVAAVFAASKNAGENDVKPAYLAKAQEMNDDDIISLNRLKDASVKTFRDSFAISSLKHRENSSPPYSLPLPDSKHLDYLLVQIVQNIESNSSQPEQFNGHKQEATGDFPGQEASSMENILTNKDHLHTMKALPAFGRTQFYFSGSLSGADKKPQDDTSDYFLGAASHDLASIAVGADSSRYQRGPCVPLIVTRFALGAILQAEESDIDCLLNNHSEVVVEDGINQDQQDPMSNSAANESLHEFRPEAVTSGVHEEGKIQPQGKPFAMNMPSWQYIKDNTTLRASLCAAILHDGYPSSSANDKSANINSELLLELKHNPTLVSSNPISCFSLQPLVDKGTFFSTKDAFRPLLEKAGMVWADEDESLDHYLRFVLLPHCLKLCLTLAEEQTNVANGRGKTDVYLGRPVHEILSTLPDPCIPLENHSENAMLHAYAILRRTRLMKSIRFVVGGGVSSKMLKEFLCGPIWRGFAMGIPIW
jgi:SNF2 family DNA or RNA helicase